MMRTYFVGQTGMAALATAGWLCCAPVLAWDYGTNRELFTNGDFDGDGRQDLLVQDRASGKYRLGYQQPDGTYQWVNHRLSGVKDVSSIAVGKLLDPNKDAIVVASTDGNQVHLIDASNRAVAGTPVMLPIDLLGPGAVAVLNVGGADSSSLQDLALATTYNDPNKLVLFRNAGGKFDKVLAEMDITEQLTHPQRAGSEANGIQFLAGIWTGDSGTALRVHDVKDGKITLVGEIKNLPKGADFVVGNFRGEELPEVVIYTHATTNATAEPAAQSILASKVESVDGGITFGEPMRIDLGRTIKLAVPVPGDGATRLLVISGKGEEAALFSADKPDGPIQTVQPKSGDAFFGAVPTEKGFVLFSGPDYSRFATQGQSFTLADGGYKEGTIYKLASMADSDDATVSDIWKRITETLAKEGIKGAADMKRYTNSVPGSKVTYSMIPVAAGEYTMGSPADEPGRNADEGPQHKVKLTPFWMAQFETTWNMYELFMYPDDEKKLRVDNETPEYVNKVSDAVTRPSKPYMEMSFGMGKDGYPAISMTQHAANKFCHWLSAKTGHFYRLPTEAEWEYACRAGTTTPYSFGADADKLSEYGWFEDNSDFKYQKVGKKKPNPWGFHDLHGNVAEWCLDQYVDNYDQFMNEIAVDPWVRSTKGYPQSVRGGSFDDAADKLRSAARRGSNKDWKMRDPQLPKSTWWLTDAQFLGFRLVRPLEIPPVEQLQKYWTSGVERD